MKKSFKFIILIILSILILTGCTTWKAFTYNVQTGDKIKVELDTSDGHNITSDLPFTVTKDDKTLCQGSFITNSGYDYYLNAVNNDSLARVIDSNDKNGVTYTFYSYNNTEFNYIIKVNGSNTGILLGNKTSLLDAQECFNLLTFTKED